MSTVVTFIISSNNAWVLGKLWNWLNSYRFEVISSDAVGLLMLWRGNVNDYSDNNVAIRVHIFKEPMRLERTVLCCLVPHQGES